MPAAAVLAWLAPAGYLPLVAIEFRRGDSGQPRGHALAYFEASDGRVFATYLVVPPVQINLAKYMPPMFAGQLGAMSPQEITAMPLPPVPEEVAGGLPELERLAELRGDDLLRCGDIDPAQIERALMRAAEAGQAYVDLYRDYLRRAPERPSAAIDTPAYDVDEVLLSLMGDHDRISELSKLVGKLRYAIDVRDDQLAEDTAAEMGRIGRYMAAKYRVDELIAAARRPGAGGARLAQLHVERCYKLAAEEYAEVGRLEAQIRDLAGEP